MLDKFIAFHKDKCQLVYQLIDVTGASNTRGFSHQGLTAYAHWNSPVSFLLLISAPLVFFSFLLLLPTSPSCFSFLLPLLASPSCSFFLLLSNMPPEWLPYDPARLIFSFVSLAWPHQDMMLCFLSSLMLLP